MQEDGKDDAFQLELIETGYGMLNKRIERMMELLDSDDVSAKEIIDERNQIKLFHRTILMVVVHEAQKALTQRRG